MNTIRNYLETMFANLPNTPEVLKAKDELWQMMEDKYSELIAEGKTENEAVGTVISEFGNLEELADGLGLDKVLHPQRTTSPEGPTYTEDVTYVTRREVTFPEVKAFLKDYANGSFLIALGVYLFCTCASPVILANGLFNRFSYADNAVIIGVSILIIMIVVGVIVNVLGAMQLNRWDFLKEELCSIDYATADYVNNENARFSPMAMMIMTIGIILCALCWVPLVLVENSAFPGTVETIMIVVLLEMIGVGVFLIVLAAMLKSRYTMLLNLNDNTTVSGHYRRKDDEVHYDNKTVEGIMSVYWPVITCIYLIISFVTFSWGSTWIIWPIAAIFKMVIETAFGGRK